MNPRISPVMEGLMQANFDVIFHGGPIAGELRAYPCDQGERIVLPCSNDDEVVYARDESAMAKDHLERTGQHAYRCVRNGIASHRNTHNPQSETT